MAFKKNWLLHRCSVNCPLCQAKSSFTKSGRLVCTNNNCVSNGGTEPQNQTKSKSKTLTLHLPIKALSVNQAWQGRRFKSPAYKEYEKEMWRLIPNDAIAPEGYYKVEIIYFCKNWKMIDLDNICKPLMDILVAKGVITNDNKIMELIVKKVPIKTDNCLEINITQL